LMKLTTCCGTAAVDRCTKRCRQGRAGETAAYHPLCADTTVVPADVTYPTDSGLLAKAVRRIAAAARRIQAAGGAQPKLRLRAAQTRNEAQAVVKRITVSWPSIGPPTTPGGAGRADALPATGQPQQQDKHRTVDRKLGELRLTTGRAGVATRR
jgi:hypothetical protein